jgi:hypothetical protein
MKKIFIIILLITTILKGYSQTSNMDAFVGTWQWSSGTDTLTLVIQKQNNVILYGNVTKPSLVGWHRYVKNGVEIESSFQYIGRDENLDHDSPNALDFKNTLFGFAKSSTTAYFTNFWNLTYHRSDEMFLTFLPSSTTQVTMRVRGHDGIYNGVPRDRRKQSMPTNLILTKQ